MDRPVQEQSRGRLGQIDRVKQNGISCWGTANIRLLLIVVVVAVAVLLFLSMSGGVGHVDAQANEPEEINSCTWINSSGSYQLTGDIQPTDTDDLVDGNTCILINSSHVDIDGAGHTIDRSALSDGTWAIEAKNTTTFASASEPEDRLETVTIRNIDFTGWPAPIGLRGVNDSEVSGIELRDTGGGADIFYEYGSTARIEDVNATSGIEDTAISLTKVTDATITNVDIERVSGSSYAISIRESPDVELTGVMVDDRNNAEEGDEFGSPSAVLVMDSPRAVVKNSTLLDVDMQGIRLIPPASGGPGSTDALVSGNEVLESQDEGIALRGANGSTVRDNHLNRTNGIDIEDSHGVAVRNNRIESDGFDDEGVHLLESSGSVVVANRIQVAFPGIEVENARPERLAANVVTTDGGRAIDIQGSSVDGYAGFAMTNTTVVGGDVRLRSYQNVSISDLAVDNGQITVERGFDGRPRNITLADVTVTRSTAPDFAVGAELSVSETTGLAIENVSFVDGYDGALKFADVREATVEGVTVTGHDDSDEESFIRVIQFTETDNTSVSGLEIVDNPMTGDDASSFSDGRVTAIDARHTNDTTFTNVEILNNTHGADAAISVGGDSSNVSLDSVRVSETEYGTIEVEDTTTAVTASAFTVGADTPTNATLSFAGSGVIVNETASPPANPDAESIGRYFDARNTSVDAFLDVDLHYDADDVTHVDEETLALWKYDSGQWTALGDSTADTTARTISANVTDFSTFGGFGEAGASGSVVIDAPINDSQTEFDVDVDFANTDGDDAYLVVKNEATGDSTTRTVTASGTISILQGDIGGFGAGDTSTAELYENSSTETLLGNDSTVVEAAEDAPTPTATPTPTETPTPTATPNPDDDGEFSTGDGAGLGLTIAVLAFVAAALLARRRR